MELSDLYPKLGDSFDYTAVEGEEPAELTEKEREELEEQELKLVVFQFKDLEHQVGVLFDRAMGEEVRAAYPDAALWSAEAFELFLKDMKQLPAAEREKQFIAVNQVKATLGGSYAGLMIAGPSER